MAAPSFNAELERFESQIEITGLILQGENDDLKISIQMDHRLKPYDWLQPLDDNATTFQFPGLMQLNNSMLIDVELKATGERKHLVARDVPCQIGRCTSWPPHKMMLHSTEPLVYYDRDDPLGEPVMRIIDATTFLRGPENFLSKRVDIKRYEFMKPTTVRGLPSVRLDFDAELGGAPVSIDHYVVHRSADPDAGPGSWVNVSGPLLQGTWVDANPPPGPLFYTVTPVIKDVLGGVYEGFPGAALRVEPRDSIFRGN